MKIRVPAYVLTLLLLFLPAADAALAGPSRAAPHRPGARELEELLAKPACFEPLPDSASWDDVEELPVRSKGITLAARLYLPRGEGPWPAVIIVPGGFNETRLIMAGPLREAQRLVRCGFAAVVFYKRGTGPSGGSYGDATYDDFIDDVGSIAKRLSRHPRIDRARIGAAGGSAGGFVASLAAARHPEIAFAVNRSGPIVPLEEENDYNIAYALRSRGYADSLVERVLPLWRRHHAAWARADTTALERVAAEIRALRGRYDPGLLPTPYREVFADTNLVFLWPTFRSATRDYMAELRTMRKPWLSVFGEKDPIVPVAASVRNIEAMTRTSGNDACTVIVLPGVGHSFYRPGTDEQVPVPRITVNWLAATVAGAPARSR